MLQYFKFYTPPRPQIITTVNPDATFETIKCDELIFPNPIFGTFVFVCLLAMILIGLSNGSAPAMIETIAESGISYGDADYDEITITSSSMLADSLSLVQLTQRNCAQHKTSAIAEAPASVPAMAEPASAEEYISISSSDCRIFPDANDRLLTRGEILEAMEDSSLSKKEFLNEIYTDILAGKGDSFADHPEYNHYYSGYEFYRQLPKCTVSRNDLTEIEAANISLISDLA